MDGYKLLELAFGGTVDLSGPAPWRNQWRDENGDPVPGLDTWGAAFQAFSEDVAPILGLPVETVLECVKRLPMEDIWCFESLYFWPCAADAVAEALGVEPPSSLFDPTVH